MDYDEIAKHCESLGYRDKLRLSQLLIQLARKEEEIQHPQNRSSIKEEKKKEISKESKKDVGSIRYVIDRIVKLKPSKKKTLMNSIRAMYQFQGGISEQDQERIIAKLKKMKFINIDQNNHVTYL
jgi:hypothetical protein